MHFAQVAFALIASGAAVLIIAGLVLEALHDREHVQPRDSTHGVIAEPVGLSDRKAPVSHEHDAAAGETPRPSERGKRRRRTGASGGDDRKATHRRRKERRASRGGQQDPAQHERALRSATEGESEPAELSDG
jgi:hypothetical protein